jgi:hypothetical protein
MCREYGVSRAGHNCRLQKKQHGLPEPGYWRTFRASTTIPHGPAHFSALLIQLT